MPIIRGNSPRRSDYTSQRDYNAARDAYGTYYNIALQRTGSQRQADEAGQAGVQMISSVRAGTSRLSTAVPLRDASGKIVLPAQTPQQRLESQQRFNQQQAQQNAVAQSVGVVSEGGKTYHFHTQTGYVYAVENEKYVYGGIGSHTVKEKKTDKVVEEGSKEEYQAFKGLGITPSPGTPAYAYYIEEEAEKKGPKGLLASLSSIIYEGTGAPLYQIKGNIVSPAYPNAPKVAEFGEKLAKGMQNYNYAYTRLEKTNGKTLVHPAVLKGNRAYVAGKLTRSGIGVGGRITQTERPINQGIFKEVTQVEQPTASFHVSSAEPSKEINWDELAYVYKGYVNPNYKEGAKIFYQFNAEPRYFPKGQRLKHIPISKEEQFEYLKAGLKNAEETRKFESEKTPYEKVVEPINKAVYGYGIMGGETGSTFHMAIEADASFSYRAYATGYNLITSSIGEVTKAGIAAAFIPGYMHRTPYVFFGTPGQKATLPEYARGLQEVNKQITFTWAGFKILKGAGALKSAIGIGGISGVSDYLSGGKDPLATGVGSAGGTITAFGLSKVGEKYVARPILGNKDIFGNKMEIPLTELDRLKLKEVARGYVDTFKRTKVLAKPLEVKLSTGEKVSIRIPQLEQMTPAARAKARTQRVMDILDRSRSGGGKIKTLNERDFLKLQAKQARIRAVRGIPDNTVDLEIVRIGRQAPYQKSLLVKGVGRRTGTSSLLGGFSFGALNRASNIQQNISRTGQSTRQTTRTTVRQFNQQRQLSRFGLRNITGQRQLARTILRTRTMTRQTNRLASVSRSLIGTKQVQVRNQLQLKKIEIIPKPTFSSPQSTDSSSWKRNFSKPSKRRFGYSPSVTASVFNIRRKLPKNISSKTFSGFELRPLPKGRFK